MTRCKHCGARALPLQTVCDYCGSPYPSAGDGVLRGRPIGAGEGRASDANPSPSETGDREFDRLLQHPELDRLLAAGPREPVPMERREGAPLRGLLLLVFAGVALGAFSRSGLHSAGGPMMIFFFLPAALSLLRRRGRDRSFPGAPLESIPARLLEVTEPWGRAQDPRPRALLETAPGQRRHLRLRRELVGELKRGDLGAAFIKADVLIDFRRVPL